MYIDIYCILAMHARIFSRKRGESPTLAKNYLYIPHTDQDVMSKLLHTYSQ